MKKSNLLILICFFSLLLSPEILMIIEEFKRRLHSTERSICLRRDLEKPFKSSKASTKFNIIPLREKDIEKFFDFRFKHQNLAALKDLINRAKLYNADIGTCYTAVNENNEPCYMQWLIGAKDNHKIGKIFRGGVSQLKADEMLLEGAFTRVAFRRNGIMPEAMSHIAEKGKEFGARWLITFVKEDNIPSLKGCKKAGFEPYMSKYTTWRFFKSSSQFFLLPGNSI